MTTVEGGAGLLAGQKVIAAAGYRAVIDAARVEGFLARLAGLEAEGQSLYSGPTAAELADVAPYLVISAKDSPFQRWFLTEAWGSGAGILIDAPVATEDLRTHLRRFLMVVLDVGKTVYFRFYDPRVLRIFLPTCDADQLRQLFGPIKSFLVEAEEPGIALRFSLAGGDLVTDRIDLTKAAPRKIEWKGKT